MWGRSLRKLPLTALFPPVSFVSILYFSAFQLCLFPPRALSPAAREPSWGCTLGERGWSLRLVLASIFQAGLCVTTGAPVRGSRAIPQPIWEELTELLSGRSWEVVRVKQACRAFCGLFTAMFQAFIMRTRVSIGIMTNGAVVTG